MCAWDIAISIQVYFWLVFVFVVGTAVGSFLNVAIARLPLEKSLVWPGSRCGKCLQAVRWYDNIPLFSFLWLWGRCRSCGEKFSMGYFLVELLTGLGFTGLFYLEVVRNIHGWPEPWPWGIQFGLFPWQSWVGFAWHALLFSFLMVASVCDLKGREIPFGLTLTGALVGLVGAVLMSWPWPWSLQEALPRARGNLVPQEVWMFPGNGLKEGIYAWPVWGPLPVWLAPGGNWQTGLATGLAGLLVGTFLLRAISFIFSAGLGKEALGLGDADLMMMAGSFLGWQPMVVAFFVSVVPALFFGIFQMVVRKDNSLPFGPSLAAGIMITCLCWGWLGPFVQPLFFWGTLLLGLAGFGALFMLVTSLGLRLLRGLRG